MDNILITVITLAYHSRYLKETIDSVLMQTYSRIQYLIIDDFSSEFVVSEMEKYIENNKKENIEEFSVCQNPVNLGTVKSYNTALRSAKGKYIFNLAGDDLFYDEFVLEEWVCEFLKRNSGIMTAYRAVYDKKMRQYKGLLPTQQQVSVILQNDTERLFEELSRGNFIFGCCTARSSDHIKKYGMCSEKYRFIDDYPINLSLTRKGETIDFWKRVVIKYRAGGMSSPVNFNDRYERDSDLIFKDEIIKYTKYPFKRWIEYHKWKYWHKGEGKITYYQNKYKNKMGKRLFIYIRYPIHALRAWKKRNLNN